MPATNFVWNQETPIYQVFGQKRKSIQEEHDISHTGPLHKRQCTEMPSHPCPTSDQAMEMMEECTADVRHPPATGQCGQLTQVTCPVWSNAQNHRQEWKGRVPPLPDPTGDHIGNDIASSNNNNNNTSNNNNTETLSGLQSEPELNNNNNNSGNQCDMIMDLNDEVFSTTSPPSDLNPNSHQPYNKQPPISQQLQPHSDPWATWPHHPGASVGATRTGGGGGVSLNPQTDAEYEAACSMMAAMEGEGAPNTQQYGTAYCDQYCVGGHRSPSSGSVRCSCKYSWESMANVRPYVSDYY